MLKTPILKEIAAYPRDYANGSLELASMVLEAWAAGLPIEELRPTVVNWIASIRGKPGIYRRSPDNLEQSSHDEWLGLAALDHIYKLGIAAEILDQGRTLGLWITGKPHSSILWGKLGVDGEWLTGWRPEYLAIMKMADGRQINGFEKWALELNLSLSTTWNLLRVRLLLLTHMGYKNLTPYYDKLGTKYKGRYGNHRVYLKLWEMNGSGYGTN